METRQFYFSPQHFLFGLTFSFLVLSCGNTTAPVEIQAPSAPVSYSTPQPKPLINAEGKQVTTRINPPEGYTRVVAPPNSFAAYLQTLPLKPHGSPVLYYNGTQKRNPVHVAVVDLDVGKKDLQQCADALMRLRAEYLYQQERYDDIQFHFTNGFLADYGTWRQGKRIVVKGNRCYWNHSASPTTSYPSFRAYLEQVFIYAGTLSLEKELHSIEYEDLQIGDILIQGGSPGHAVIVIDMALSLDEKPPLYLLAQSYMPAQEIHVLKNGTHPNMGPWYERDLNQTEILTPEWRFYPTNIRRFE